MPNTGLHGPYSLDEASINAHVYPAIGAYALGYMNGDTFVIKYVGRSDTDLNSRLKSWTGKYKTFKYGHLKTKIEAFAHECRMFHDFGELSLDNEVHPARPSGETCSCPVGGCRS